MSQELERVYTINLGKALLSVDTHRATRAINMIKEYARRHMKVEDVKIEEDLAHQIWARGARHPPRKIRVRMSKTDEGYILVSRFDEEAELEVTPATETKKVDDKVAPEPEEETKEAELKEPEEEPAKEEAELKEPEEEPAKEEAELKEPEEEPAKEEKKDAPKKE